MKIQIKNRYTGVIIYECEAENLKEAVNKAVSEKASLYKADLSGAYLSGADLYGAYLSGANLYGAKGIISFTGFGDEKRFGYVWKKGKEIIVRLGCSEKPLKETLKLIRKKYGKNSNYEAMIKLCAKELIKHYKGEKEK